MRRVQQNRYGIGVLFDRLSLGTKPEHDPDNGRGLERSTGLKGGNTAHIRAVDDFQAIRAPMEELRRERDVAAVTEADCGSVEPARRRNNATFVSICRLLDVAGRMDHRKLGSLDLYLSAELGDNLQPIGSRPSQCDRPRPFALAEIADLNLRLLAGGQSQARQQQFPVLGVPKVA